MRAYIEHPDINEEERIEIKGLFHVVTQALKVEDIIEAWEKKRANLGQ